MKSRILIVLSIAILGIMGTSCSKDEDEEIHFEETLLHGKWVSGTEFQKFNADLTGSTWDTKDDTKEEEAQKFTWTLTKDQLEQIHLIQGGGVVPKVYTVTVLNATNLNYQDELGKKHTFTKVIQE
jgi:hypothetical protein